jgi:2-polyprenyl-3-methyl-5-hydroxy-6-metoxy-1,4-benzoquinol methylase
MEQHADQQNARFDWNQVRDYWRGQRSRAGRLDEIVDPDALGNVCHAGAPIWFNQYYARHQRTVFEMLLGQVPFSDGARALDVGCGAGRWCRLLSERGFRVHGIDLQQSLIERNRARYPNMSFDCVPIQDFSPPAPFDLVTTVTVIQHVPFDEQKRALAKIASILKPGGHVLSLENVNDQGAHVFANSIEGWAQAFGDVGLSLVTVRRYDYSPAIRLTSAAVNVAAQVARRLGVISRQDGPAVPQAPTAEGMNEGSPIRRALRAGGWAIRRAAVQFDDRIEGRLIAQNANFSTVHCGFLFQKQA